MRNPVARSSLRGFSFSRQTKVVISGNDVDDRPSGCCDGEIASIGMNRPHPQALTFIEDFLLQLLPFILLHCGKLYGTIYVLMYGVAKQEKSTMVMKKLACSLAAFGLVTAPVAATAQEAERATQPATEQSEMGGSGFLAMAIMVAVIAGGVWLVVDDDDDDPVSA